MKALLTLVSLISLLLLTSCLPQDDDQNIINTNLPINISNRFTITEIPCDAMYIYHIKDNDTNIDYITTSSKWKYTYVSGVTQLGIKPGDVK